MDYLDEQFFNQNSKSNFKHQKKMEMVIVLNVFSFFYNGKANINFSDFEFMLWKRMNFQKFTLIDSEGVRKREYTG